MMSKLIKGYSEYNGFLNIHEHLLNKVDKVPSLITKENYASILIRSLTKINLLFANKDNFNSSVLSSVMTSLYFENKSSLPNEVKIMRCVHHISTLYLGLRTKHFGLYMKCLKSIEFINLFQVFITFAQNEENPNAELIYKLKQFRFLIQFTIRSIILFLVIKEFRHMKKNEIDTPELILVTLLQLIAVNEILFCYKELLL